MPLKNQISGQSIAEEMNAQPAEPSEQTLREETGNNLALLYLVETKKALTALQTSIESYTRTYSLDQKQMNKKMGELSALINGLIDRMKDLDPTKMQEEATAYAATVANKFDSYCERILTQRVGDSLKKLDKVADELGKRPADEKRSRWIKRITLVLSGLSCLFLLMLLVLHIF